MDFNDTPEEARFRKEASSWLAENAPTDDAFRALSPLEQAKTWQKRKYDAGWACMGWAPEFGGRGASAIEEVIWRQEESQEEASSRKRASSGVSLKSICSLPQAAAVCAANADTNRSCQTASLPIARLNSFARRR